MLSALGVHTIDELYNDVPVEARLKEPFTLPEALSEYDLKKVMQNLAGRNISASDAVCFLGAGQYDHFVPSIVTKMTAKVMSDLNGADDISSRQDALKLIYECTQYLANLCGTDNIDVSYASVADALDCVVSQCKGKSIVVLRSVNPEYKKVLSFLCNAYGIELKEAACKDGTTSNDELLAVLSENTAMVIAQNPNYFGIIEDMSAYSAGAHSVGAKFTAIVDPISLALLSTPNEYCADYAIASAQPLGQTLSFGAPSFVFLADYSENNVKVVNFENDTFTADIKKISKCRFSAIVTSFVYLAYMGDGIVEVAKNCYSNAYYTYEKLTATTSFKAVFNKPFFREFAVKATKKNVNDINNRMLDYGMIGGPQLKPEYPELGNSWLVAVTEKRSADEVELFVKEASRQI